MLGASGTGWACALVGNGISCASTDAIANAQSFPDITIAAKTSTATGFFDNTSVVSNSGDTNPNNNTDIAYIGVGVPVTVPTCSAITTNQTITNILPGTAVTYSCNSS